MEKTTQIPPFTKDRPVFALALLTGLITTATVLATVFRLKGHSAKVPVQYIVNDGSVLQTANWYSLYSIVLFAIVGTVFAIFLSRRLHASNRLFSVSVLIIYILISIVGFLVTNALLGLVGRV